MVSVPTSDEDQESLQVVYLMGAGATQGSADFYSTVLGLLTSDLNLDIAERLSEASPNLSNTIRRLINDLIVEGNDIEHVITFLHESSSAEHMAFAEDLRQIFRNVLADRLEAVAADIGRQPSGLYEAVIDMHQVDANPEALRGILTLNYDGLIEYAAKQLGQLVDLGIGEPVVAHPDAKPTLKLLKLHGSFDWNLDWPMSIDSDPSRAQWIPPGIQKVKDRYPYNLIWGSARDMLDCDILRVIGCRLGGKDWDLISMLFAAIHSHGNQDRPMKLEIIGWACDSDRIKKQFPYLRPLGLADLPEVGEAIVAEALGGRRIPFDQLIEKEQDVVNGHINRMPNPFLSWLKFKAETMDDTLGSVQTDDGIFERILESQV